MRAFRQLSLSTNSVSAAVHVERCAVSCKLERDPLLERAFRTSCSSDLCSHTRYKPWRHRTDLDAWWAAWTGPEEDPEAVERVLRGGRLKTIDDEKNLWQIFMMAWEDFCRGSGTLGSPVLVEFPRLWTSSGRKSRLESTCKIMHLQRPLLVELGPAANAQSRAASPRIQISTGRSKDFDPMCQVAEVAEAVRRILAGGPLRTIDDEMNLLQVFKADLYLADNWAAAVWLERAGRVVSGGGFLSALPKRAGGRLETIDDHCTLLEVFQLAFEDFMRTGHGDASSCWCSRRSEATAGPCICGAPGKDSVHYLLCSFPEVLRSTSAQHNSHGQSFRVFSVEAAERAAALQGDGCGCSGPAHCCHVGVGDPTSLTSAAMDQSSTAPPALDAAELRAVCQTCTVKELKKLLTNLAVDLSGYVEKSELVDAAVRRLDSDGKAKLQLFSYCRICCNWCLDDDVWPLTCGHLACFQCLGTYLESQIQAMKSSLKYNLPCIYAPACSHEMRFQDAASMSAALRNLWKDLQQRERLIRDAKYEVLECPQPGCVGVAYKERGRRTAMCFMCEHTWEANADGTDDDGKKPNFDGTRVRKCPKCQAPIEKNGGCNHMHCTRCGRHFDWTASQSAGDPNAAPSEAPFGNFNANNLWGDAAAAFEQFFPNMHNTGHAAAHAQAHDTTHQAAHAQAQRAQAQRAQQRARAGPASQATGAAPQAADPENLFNHFGNLLGANAPGFQHVMGNVLSLLEEQENQLRCAALQRLNEVVDQFWHEIADYLNDIETLYEDPAFPGREMAALVASKVFYHLEEYDDALRLALGAGQLFDLNQRSEYVEKIVAVAIDEYVKLTGDNFELEMKKKDPVPIDTRLEDVVNRMFARCMEDRAYKHGLGMALETRRLDKVTEFIKQSDAMAEMLEYAQLSAMTLLTSKAFRERVLKALVEIHTSVQEVNLAALAQCYFILGEPGEVAKILKDLLGRSEKDPAWHITTSQPYRG
eukprot:s5107_g2.t9